MHSATLMLKFKRMIWSRIMSISGTIKSIQDTMREDVGVDGDVQRLGQLVWMLFLKVVDDRETEAETLALLEG